MCQRTSQSPRLPASLPTNMIVTEIKDAAVEFLNHQVSTGFEGRPSRLYGFSGERTPGLHLSDILQDLYIRLNKPKRRGEEEAGPELLWTLGLGWEHLLSWAWSQAFPEIPHQVIHPGEFQKDGIWMTPDRVDVGVPCVIEMKCTFKSFAKNPIDDMWYYIVQGKAYCHALELDRCRYYVMFIKDLLGGYGHGMIPPKVWDVEFTKGELERNWEMITNHRDLMIREGKIK